MPSLKQFRSRDLSLWQSAADEVVSKHKARTQTLALGVAAPITRPDMRDPRIQAATQLCEEIAAGKLPPTVPHAITSITLAAGDSLRFCSVTAFKLAEAEVKAAFTGDRTEVNKLKEALGAQFNQCDPRWTEVIAVYAAYHAAGMHIPYRRDDPDHTFVIEDRLPSQAKLALVADWGTGQDSARMLLKQIADKDPDVVIHLGDIYYSGTDHEVENYFYKLWQSTLGIPATPWGSKLQDLNARPASFSLSGNHDMYAGGAPYYKLIDMLGQPASYFCLRNQDWQFIALDTGLHDSNPTAGALPFASRTATFLEDTEVAWLRDRINAAGQRKNILLSHHQLFSAYETIAGHAVNQDLLAQVQEFLPQVTAWFWGHEHDLIIYENFQNVQGRCIGHGAFPVPVGPPLKLEPSVPVKDIKLEPDSIGGLFQHGYALMELDGPSAQVSYFEYDPDTNKERVLHSEVL